MNTQVSEDIARAESIAMPIVFVLSLLIFGSLVSALMPTMVGMIAVFGAFAVVRLITVVTDVSVFSINVITLLGMGLAIDYALFVVSRFREELARRPGTGREDVAVAVTRTMATAGRTVLFSGVIVAASLSSLLVFPQNFLRSMGYGGMAAVLVAMVASLTVLPAVLTLLGRRLEWGAMPWRRRAVRAPTTVAPGPGSRAASCVARSSTSSPPVALLLLASPVLGARWGSVDERVLPADSPSRVAAETVADRFGGETASADVVVTGTDAAETEAYAASLRRGRRRRRRAHRGHRGRGRPAASLVQATWLGNAQTRPARTWSRSCATCRPPTAPPPSSAGRPPTTVDLVDSVFDRCPGWLLIVAVVMLVLLFLAFGSVVLPIKAIVMNADLDRGVVRRGDLDLPGRAPVRAARLHLARLPRRHPADPDAGDPVRAVDGLRGVPARPGCGRSGTAPGTTRPPWPLGLQRTGRIITSAALLLAVVIGGFATSGIVFIKMIGVGMLVAVLLDATVVRALLVPATMRLLGRFNWWAPAPLARWWERHGHREEPLPVEPSSRVPTPVG